MTPTLTRSGIFFLSVGAGLVFTGALITTWPLIAIGFAQISALLVCYMLFIPTCVLIRRRHLEFAWWVPASESSLGALLTDRPILLHLLLLNHSPFRLLAHNLRIMASSSLDIDKTTLALIFPSRTEVLMHVRITPRAAGIWFFHGMSLEILDLFGLFVLQLYYPNLITIKVFPKLSSSKELISFQARTGALHERVGRRIVRQRGFGSDLREIRDHIPGDPFKRMAWKATARTRKLMVREFESEILVTHWLLLDISSTMRSSRPGKSKLDYGLDLCASFARQAIEAGDRVGLITFDHRMYSHINPSDGRPHIFRIIDRLMELHTIVDEDLTDLSDPELYSAIADFLAHQEGIDVRLSIPFRKVHESRWSHLIEGARGELLDSTAMTVAITSLLQKRRGTGASWWWNRVNANSPFTAQLRLFCRLSGIEIPYRQSSSVMSKDRGMAAAIQQASAPRHSQFILLITDLEDMTEKTVVLNALRLAKQKNHSIVVVAPYAPTFLSPAENAHEKRIQSIFALRANRERRNVKQSIESLGIPVLSAEPSDAFYLLLRRLRTHRDVRRSM